MNPQNYLVSPTDVGHSLQRYAANDKTVAARRIELNANIGRRIAMRRMALGMSREELGDVAGLTAQQIQNYEAGDDHLSVIHLIEIAASLDINPVYFIHGRSDEISLAFQQQEVGSNSQLPVGIEDASAKDAADLADLFFLISRPTLRKSLIEVARGLVEGSF